MRQLLDKGAEHAVMKRLSASRLKSGILYLPEQPVYADVLRRIGIAISLILIVSVLLWFTRGGLLDSTHPGRPMRFADVFYFAVITLTTVGYGDIVPHTHGARLVNALLLTPIRVFLWALFLGTAYDLVIQRYKERIQMRKLQDRLSSHTIVCGFGVKGRSCVSELMAHGAAPSDIVVIDSQESAVAGAAGMDIAALRGDASSEAILRAAGIDDAQTVIVAANRDDASVLVCLTVRSLNSAVKIVAAAREEENVKLLYNAGADVVVSPSVSGGRLMAAAVRQEAVTAFMEDLLHFGEGVDAGERRVDSSDAGKLAADLEDLKDKLVLGVQRGTQRCPFHKLPTYLLQEGDRIVFLTSNPECRDTPGPTSRIEKG